MDDGVIIDEPTAASVSTDCPGVVRGKGVQYASAQT